MTPSSPTARKKRRLLLAGAILAVLAGAGVVAASLRGDASAAKDADDPAKTVPGLPPSVLTFDPFILNLADDEGDRYLRATVRVVFQDVKTARTLEPETLEYTRLRDRLLTILSSKRAAEITTFEGKEALRRELASAVAVLLENRRVLDFLFVEFLVQ